MQDLFSQRALQGQLSIARAGIFQLNAAVCLLLDPGEILVTIRRIDADQKIIRLDTIKDNVIHDSALFIHQEIVLSLL